MPRPRKKERNKEIVHLRKKGLSYGKIGKYMKINRSAVYRIYQRDKNKS
jgi:DNA invertase Pin-like site-specific DNA recombinase